MDKIKHFALCFIVTAILGWKYGVCVGLTIELTQAEQGNPGIKIFLERLFSKDSLLDMVADSIGILYAILLIQLLP